MLWPRSKMPDVTVYGPEVTEAGNSQPLGTVASDGAATATRRRKRMKLCPYGFLAVPMAAIILIEVMPTLGVVWLSFTDYNPLVEGSWHSFVGLDNWARLFGDSRAWQAFFQ